MPVTDVSVAPASAAPNVQEVALLVAELTGRDPAGVRPSDRLRDDLGLDSLQSMELLSRLTEDHGVEPRMDEVVKVLTVADAAALVARLTARA